MSDLVSDELALRAMAQSDFKEKLDALSGVSVTQQKYIAEKEVKKASNKLSDEDEEKWQ